MIEIARSSRKQFKEARLIWKVKKRVELERKKDESCFYNVKEPMKKCGRRKNWRGDRRRTDEGTVAQ